MTDDEAERIYIHRVAYWIDRQMTLPEAHRLAGEDRWDSCIPSLGDLPRYQRLQ